MSTSRWNVYLGASGDEGGFTLLEMLVAVVIMAIAFIGLMAMMFTLVASSVSHRQSVRAGLSVTQIAETLQGATYVPCTGATTPDYTGALPVGSGFTATITSIEYLAPTTTTTPPPTSTTIPTATFVGSCPAAGDQGVQVLHVRVVSTATPGPNRPVGRQEELAVTMRNNECPANFFPNVGNKC